MPGLKDRHPKRSITLTRRVRRGVYFLAAKKGVTVSFVVHAALDWLLAQGDEASGITGGAMGWRRGTRRSRTIHGIAPQEKIYVRIDPETSRRMDALVGRESRQFSHIVEEALIHLMSS